MEPDPATTRLGRGLGSMFDEVSGIKAGSKSSSSGFMRIPLVDIRASEYNRVPDQMLCESIKKYGVLQPILVVHENDRYKLLAGSRRLQAASKAGLSDIPALIIPPDRAGKLDVFLEENLSRAELNDDERAILRDRWMKETGRDEQQAGLRIPTVVSATDGTPVSSGLPISKHWRLATVAACLLSIFLMVLLIQPRETIVSDQMDTTVEAIIAEEFSGADAQDSEWMNDFRFPGNLRVAGENSLTIFHTKPGFDNGANINPAARIFFFQLAAVTLSARIEAVIEVTGYGNADANSNERYQLGLERAAVAAHLLQGEGILESDITIKGSTQRPVDKQTLKVTIQPK